MTIRRTWNMTALLGIFVLSPAAWAQWESGSDGSDGAFSPAVSTVVDLSLAASLCDCDGDTQVDDPCRWDCSSPVAGRGVYDAEQWAVVYKYTTIDVAAGATITFGMHPSGAPVVWLATGNVTISGTVNLDGEDGLNTTNPPVVPYYTRPGPGGFEGGQQGNPGAGSFSSIGLGPGSSPVIAWGCNPNGAPAAYADSGGAECSGTGPGSIYGNVGILPLIGGSGGNQDENPVLGGGGGAGGGAILVSAPALISFGTAGAITAEGGNGGGGGSLNGGAGSGGAIRLRAETVTMPSGSRLVGRYGTAGYTISGNGRIRVEAGTFNNGGTISGSQSFVGAPSAVFPPTPPQLYVTTICGQPAPAEPDWGMKTTDVDLSSPSACTINISGTGMPVGTIVVVRVIPARGNIISVNSTPMVDAGGGLRTATASVTFPAGRSELQLRANW